MEENIYMITRYNKGRKINRKQPKPRPSLTGLLGIAIFFYFSFDLVLKDYDLKGTLVRIAIAIMGLLIPIIAKARRES